MFTNDITITPSATAYTFTEVEFKGLATPQSRIQSCVWDFGDGTFASTLEATHVYQNPGEYDITYNICTDSGSAYNNTASLTVVDYVSSQIGVSAADTVGFPGDVFWYQITATGNHRVDSVVLLKVEGSNSLPYDGDFSKPQYRFVDQDYEIITQTSLTSVDLSGSSFSGSAIVGFIDDSPGSPSISFILAAKDEHVNSQIFTTETPVISALSAVSVRITQDGSAELRGAQWAGSNIPMVITIADSAGEQNIYNVTGEVSVSAFVDGVHFYTLTDTLEAFNLLCAEGGSLTTEISACSSGSLSFTASLDGTVVSCFVSDTILYPFYDRYTFYVQREDVRFTDALKQFVPSRFVEDNPSLYQFLEALFGNNRFGGFDELGLSINTAIENLIQNKSDIDLCTIRSLNDHSLILGSDINHDVPIPPDMRRIVDLMSIEYGNLVGTSSYRYAVGCEIDIDNTLLVAGDIIRAYNVIDHTDQDIHIVPIDSVSSYTLADIEDDNPYSVEAPFKTNYKFYRISTVAAQSNSWIDYDNCYTLLQPDGYSHWTAEGGVMETVFEYYLLKGLELVTPCSAIDVECVSTECA